MCISGLWWVLREKASSTVRSMQETFECFLFWKHGHNCETLLSLVESFRYKTGGQGNHTQSKGLGWVKNRSVRMNQGVHSEPLRTGYGIAGQNRYVMSHVPMVHCSLFPPNFFGCCLTDCTVQKFSSRSIRKTVIGSLGRQSSRCGHGELGTKQANWPKDCRYSSSNKEGQAGCRETCRKSNENKSEGAVSGSLNDSFFHEASKPFTGKNIPAKPLCLNNRTSNDDDFWHLFLCIRQNQTFGPGIMTICLPLLGCVRNLYDVRLVNSIEINFFFLQFYNFGSPWLVLTHINCLDF